MLQTKYVERAQVGRTITDTIHMRPIAYREAGTLRAMDESWSDSGDGARPHIVSRAPLMISAANDGVMRWHPTRDPQVYLEIGDPVYRVAGDLRTFDFANPSRNRNRIRWDKTAASLIYEHGGDFGKMGLLFHTAAYQGIDNREFAFPLTYAGLTRSGRNILRNGSPVMRLRPFVAYDLDNDLNRVPVPHEFRTVQGQEYVVVTLPVAMDSMSRPVLDPTLELQPDATAGVDTFINDHFSADDLSFGVHTQLQIGDSGTVNCRSMIQFDISSLPAGATLTSATLGLYIESEANTTDRDIRVHRAITQWWEGDGNGTAPSGDGSTWRYRNENGPIHWAGGFKSGGGSGSDYVASATDQVTITGTGAFFDLDVLTDVDAWYQETATNYGLFLINVDENTSNSRKTASSSDHGTAAQRPKLTIVYTEPGAGVSAAYAILRRMRA